MIAGTDAAAREHVRESCRALVGLRVGEAAGAADEGLVIGHGVGDAFPEVGQVEVHRSPGRAWSYLNQMRW